MFKRILFTLIALFILNISTVYADDAATVKDKFNSYVRSANTYSPDLFDYYSPNAKIIRQVVKSDGTTVNATTDMGTYEKQMRLSQSTAKMRNYKNVYKNVTTSQVSNGIKVSALRQPSNETYWLKTYQIWQKQQNGSWKIVEEMMQTKQQIFLRYADSGQ